MAVVVFVHHYFMLWQLQDTWQTFVTVLLPLILCSQENECANHHQQFLKDCLTSFGQILATVARISIEYLCWLPVFDEKSPDGCWWMLKIVQEVKNILYVWHKWQRQYLGEGQYCTFAAYNPIYVVLSKCINEICLKQWLYERHFPIK